jgi:hypothetical protein
MDLEFYSMQQLNPGFSPSGFMQVIPELGYQFTESFSLSAVGRFQFISQKGSGEKVNGAPATGAASIMARAAYYLGERNAQAVLSLFAGGGEGFRLTVGPQDDKIKLNDSVRGGPFVVGPGIGLIYHLTSYMAATVDLRALAGAPSFAVVGDLGAGLQFGF